MVRNASCSPSHPLSHRPCFHEGLWLEMNSPSMTQLGKRSSNLSTSFWQTRLERNHQDVLPRHALTSMTCFTRLPEDTALSKDGWIPSSESKWEMMASEKWWQDILLDPLSWDAHQQSATMSSVSLCCVFSSSVSSEDRARGIKGMGLSWEPWFFRGKRVLLLISRFSEGFLDNQSPTLIQALLSLGAHLTSAQEIKVASLQLNFQVAEKRRCCWICLFFFQVL